MIRILHILVASAMALMTLGCLNNDMDSSEGGFKYIAITDIELDMRKLTLVTGQTYELMVTVYPENASDRDIIWESENSNVVYVSRDGVVSAQSAGETIISAKADNGKIVKSCHVSVFDVSFEKSDLMLGIGDTYVFNITGLPENVSQAVNVRWDSSNSTVAYVSDNGEATGYVTGNAVISCYIYGRFIGSCSVTVFDPAKELILTKNNAYEILGYDWKNKKEIIIPDGVTSIGEEVFQYCLNLESVSIPNTVTSIGYEAFSGCKNLKNIAIGDNVTTIEGCAFEFLESLEAIEIPDSVISIGGKAFSGCGNLKKVDLGNNVVSIGDSAFSFSGLESVEIPNSVTSIGDYTFYCCKNLKSIVILDSAVSIGEYAFNNCENLQNLDLGNGITNIGSNAFAYCSGLTEVEIPDSECLIDSMAFSNCENIEVITIGASAIGESAFAYQKGLKKVVLTNNVTSIGDFAFNNSSIECIVIGTGVKSIGKSAFEICENLKEVHVKSADSWCAISFENISSNPICYTNEKQLYIGDKKMETELVIPEGVTAINAYAFIDLYNLENVVIPNSVVSIGDYAFFRCENLKSVHVGSNVKYIGNSAFSSCYNIDSVYVTSQKSWENIDFSYENNTIRDANIFIGTPTDFGINITIKKQLQSDISNIKYSINGNNITISAEEGHSAYSWFVDMEKQTEANNTLQLDAATMEAGLHSVMVVIDDSYSSTATVEIFK